MKDGGEKEAIMFAGQLAAVLDSSGGEEWTVRLLTGEEVGRDVSLPRHHLQPYTGSMTHSC